MASFTSLTNNRRIEMTIERMRHVRHENQGGKHHLNVARHALDEIMATKEYEFGKILFEKLAESFTDVKPELNEMLDMIKDEARS